jgi:ribonuclease BN (tRNA processing enzyme)
VLLDCGATSLTALRQCGLPPGEVAAVFVSHLHGDHFGGLPFLILDGQFSRRTAPLLVAGPAGTRQRLREAMECLFPGSAEVRRRFDVEVTELAPGQDATLAGVTVTAWEADHPSGAPALALRLAIGGQAIAYTGDTAWTEAITEAAAGADLLIAEAYYRDKPIPYHLRLADLVSHRDQLGCERIVLTHMSADVLDHLGPAAAPDHLGTAAAPDGLSLAGFQAAHDGMVIRLA